jgi:hypothetical protein
MKIQTTRPFDIDYDSLPELIKDRADKQFTLLLENPNHPSLRLKKMDSRISGRAESPRVIGLPFKSSERFIYSGGLALTIFSRPPDGWMPNSWAVS